MKSKKIITSSSWEGVYKNWDEANSKGKGFIGKRWASRITNQLEKYKEEIRLYGKYAIPPRPSSLPFLYSIDKFNTIADFGGSSGWLWYYFNNCFPKSKLDEYIIIENENICKVFDKSSYHKKRPIRYSTMDKFNSKCEVFYTNSTIQYINDDESFINLIIKTNPRYILIEDFIGGAFDDYYSTQIYYKDRIPVKFRNEKKFINKIENLSFDIIFSDNYVTKIRGIMQPFPMSKIPKSKRIRFGKTILFKQRNQ